MKNLIIDALTRGPYYHANGTKVTSKTNVDQDHILTDEEHEHEWRIDRVKLAVATIMLIAAGVSAVLFIMAPMIKGV